MKDEPNWPALGRLKLSRAVASTVLKHLAALLLLLASGLHTLWGAPGDLKWRVTLGSCITKVPTLATNGDLLVGTCEGRLYALTSSGSNRWSFATPWTILGTPAVAPDGTIYFGSDKLYALNADGSKRWEVNIGLSYPSGYSVSAGTPVIGPDGVIYFARITSLGGERQIQAINPDGTLRWKSSRDYICALAIGEDGAIYGPSDYGGFGRVNPDGTEQWNQTAGNTTSGAAALTADGTVLVPVSGGSVFSGALQAFRPDGGGLWRFEGGAQALGSPVVGPDGNVYYGFDSGRMVCLTPTGQLRWEYMMAGTNAPYRITATPALAADGTVLFSGDHWLHALDSNGQLLWRFDGGSDTLGSPLIAPDGTIYVNSTSGPGTLSAIEGTGAGLAGAHWPMAARDPRHSASLATTLVSPLPPTNIIASMTNFTEKVRVSWPSVPRATYYQVLRGESPAAEGAVVLTNALTGASFFDDRSAVPGVLYYYFVRAWNAAGQSGLSEPVAGKRRVSVIGEPDWIFPTGSWLNGTPALGTHGEAYFGCGDGKFYAVDGDGQQLWTYSYGGSSSSSPSLGADGTLYFAGAISRYPSATTNALFALTGSGQLKWRIILDASSVSGVALGADQTVYVATSDPIVGSRRVLLAVAPDGAIRWSYTNGRNFYSTPVVGADGTIYAGTSDGWMEALRPDGTLLWESNTGDSYLGSPIIDAHGVLFFGGVNFHALNSDGQQLWSYQTSWGGASASCLDPQGMIYGHAESTYYTLASGGTNTHKWLLPGYLDSTQADVQRDAQGTLYLSVYSGIYSDMLTGKIYALSPSGTVQWEYDLYQVTFGSPALGAGSRLYVPGADGRLYVFHTAAGTDNSPWPHPLHDAQRTGRATVAPPAPAAPSTVNATVRTRVTDVRVSWNSVLSAVSYDVYRASTTNLAEAVLLASVTGQLSFDDKTAMPEATYTYWVRAKNMTGNSPMSSSATGIRRQAVSGELLYEWTLSGAVNSSPAIAADGTIYVSAGKKLSALRSDGTTRWEYSITAGGWSSPTVGPDGTIYAGVQNSLGVHPNPSPLLALNADGTKRWECRVSDNLSSTPALGADGTIYIATDSGYSGAGGSLYAVSPLGQILWSLNIGSATDSSIAIGRDGTLYVFTRDGHLHAVHPNGFELWNVAAGITSGAVPSPALGSDGTIYVGAGTALKAYNPDGTLSWLGTNISCYSAPVLAPNGTVLVSAQDGYFYNLRNGTNVWRSQVGMVNRGAPACSSDGLVFVPGQDGKLFALTLNGSNVWQTAFGGLWSRGPTIAPDGTIYVGGDDGKLRSIFGNATLANTSWPMFQHDSGHSGRDSAPAALPAAPGPVQATDGTYNDRVRLTWATVPRASSYEVWRHTLNDWNSAVRLATNIAAQTYYDDKSAVPGTNYYYWMRAVNGAGAGPYSLADTGYRRIAVPGELLGEYRVSYMTVSAPALAQNGTVYVGYSNGRLYALEPNLAKRWEFYIGASGTVYAPAVGPDGTVYFWASNSKFYALNADGTQRWTFLAASPQQLSAAIAADGTIVVPAADRTLYGLKTDGTLCWEYRAASNIVTSPSLAADGSVYFGSDDGQLYALGPQGALRWRFRVNGPVRSTPAIGSDGTVYFGADDRGCYAVSPEGRRLWAVQASDAIVAAPVIGPDATIYFASKDSKLYAVQPDGTLKWSYQADSALQSSAAVGADGIVYVGSKNGRVYALNSAGANLWTYNSATGSVSSSVLEAPVLTEDQRILVPTTQGALQALTVTAGAPNCNWPQARGDAQRTAQAKLALSLTNDLAALRLIAGEQVTFYANYTLTNHTVTRLELLAGTNVLATATNGLLAVTWHAVGLGTNRLWLRLTDDQNWVTMSAPAVLVGAPPPSLQMQTGPDAARQIAFDSLSGRVYQVERSLDLQNWTAIGEPVRAQEERIDWPELSPAPSAAFYRVRLLPDTQNN